MLHQCCIRWSLDERLQLVLNDQPRCTFTGTWSISNGGVVAIMHLQFWCNVSSLHRLQTWCIVSSLHPPHQCCIRWSVDGRLQLVLNDQPRCTFMGTWSISNGGVVAIMHLKRWCNVSSLHRLQIWCFVSSLHHAHQCCIKWSLDERLQLVLNDQPT